MRMHKSLRPLFASGTVASGTIAALAMAMTLLLPAMPAAATASCSGAGNWFDGAYKSGTSLYAVDSTISKPNIPGLCGSTHSDVSVWSMIASGSNANTLGYAQSGYGRTHGESNVYYFAEYHHPYASGDVFKEGGVAAGGVEYDEYYDFSGGRIHMTVGSSTFLTTDYDPILYWSAPWQAQWFGETHDRGDDMPGTSSNPAYFSSLLIRTCRGCGLTTPSGVSLSDTYTTRYGEAWNTTNSKFHIWTK
jgi:hypothetical protein